MSLFGFGDDANSGFLSDAHDTCVDWAEPIGFGTGMIYSEIAGPAVGVGVQGFVEDGWANGVCEMAFGDSNESGGSSDSSE